MSDTYQVAWDDQGDALVLAHADGQQTILSSIANNTLIEITPSTGQYEFIAEDGSVVAAFHRVIGSWTVPAGEQA